MIPAGNSNQAREIDKLSVESGIPSYFLMENAAFSLFLEAEKIIKDFVPEKVVLLAGAGGNGGDGFALLRMIEDRIGSIPLFSVNFFEEQNLKGDTLLNFTMLPECVEFIELHQVSGRVLFIDAIIGTGLKKELSSHILDGVRFVNNYENKKVLSVDVPTGLSGDTGHEMPESISADVTVSLAILKEGLFLSDGIGRSGKVVSGAISASTGSKKTVKTFVVQECDFSLPELKIDSYKNKNGHALFIGGSLKKMGAIFIAAQAFMAAGGGLATVALEEETISVAALKFPGIMLEDINEIKRILHKFDVLVIGPGLELENENIVPIIRDFEGKIVVDAGMFDSLTKNPDYYYYLEGKSVVFTPHPGELGKYLSEHSEKSWRELVDIFPLGEKHILYAKNAASFIKSREKTVIIPHGARALSFGGTGDMLSGIIAAFLQKIPNNFEAVTSAGILHRRAGLMIEENFSAEYHDIKTLIKQIPKSINYLRGMNENRKK